MALLVNRACVKEFVGESGEVKPVLKPENVGSDFYEMDTDDVYLWAGTEWIKL